MSVEVRQPNQETRHSDGHGSLPRHQNPHSARDRDLFPASVSPECPNGHLLSVYPELYNFWDGKGWRITADSLCQAAATAGVKPRPNQAQETAELYDTVIPYDVVPIERINGAPIALQPDMLLIEETLGLDFAAELAAEFGASTGSDPCLPLEELFAIQVFQIAAPKGVVLDRTLVGDALLDRILPIHSEVICGLADKVAQRNLVATATSSQIEQPRYVDVRGVNPPDTCVEFRNISFDAFPTAKVARTSTSKKKIWVFEDCRQGFAVVSDGKRQYVHSDNPCVCELISENKLDAKTSKRQGFSSRLERFLTQLSTSDFFGVSLLRGAPELSRQRLDLARSIIAHRGDCFVKSSRSFDGILVVRVQGGAEREAVIQSDSVEIGELLKHYMLDIESIRQAAKKQDLTALERVALNQQRNMVQRRASLAGFLERAIVCMEAPIVEETIPVARLSVPEGSEKVECRLIFQGESEIELAGHYCKASPNQTVANIARGGYSRRTRDVIYALHLQHLRESLAQEDIDTRARESFRCLLVQTTLLARAFVNHYREILQKPLSDFALDICPVWDSERGTLRFMFLETQFTYGFSGLTHTRPDIVGPTIEDLMADRISRFKAKIAARSDPLGLLSRIGSNLHKLEESLGLSRRAPPPAAIELFKRRLRE